jgi:hypothetical protein
MRRTVTIETGLAVLLAFFFAPFQHIHSGSGEVHSHFIHSGSPSHPAGVHLEADDDDDHAHARSLDTFMPVIPGGLIPWTPARAAVVSVVPTVMSAPAETVEERAHDPPHVNHLSPRGPPL